MNFNIKDVKSWANRHDVETKSGTGFITGFFGNSLLEIDNEIRRYNKGEKGHLHELYQISDNGCFCFGYAVYFADTGAFGGTSNFAFFLPLDAVKKDKPKKKYRPFKDTYEFYNFIGVILTITRKEFRDRMLLGLPITWRKKDTSNFTTTEIITSVDVAVIDGCQLTSINGKELEYWFNNYEIMNVKGEWQPFGAIEDCTGE